ncbi:MAG: hypothetical protein IJ271_06260 [Bacteroidales bacterium]|jgi:hypothetical protein|nr:hypothetical protein [Bacteroidales bacterium]
MTTAKEVLVPLVTLAVLVCAIFFVIGMVTKAIYRIRETMIPLVSTEIIHVEQDSSNILTLSCHKSVSKEEFDVFFQLASGKEILLYDSEGNCHEYWFPCSFSEKRKQSYKIVTTSEGKDLLTLTIISHNRIIHRYLDINISEK